MEQLILHLIGDYVTQSHAMAKHKRTSWVMAFIHAAVYALPFSLLGPSLHAITVIWLSHMVIDRLGLARYVVFTKNLWFEPQLKWEDCQATGYPPDVPPWMAVWLLIIADNTIHLAINYAALRWL